MYKTIAAGVAGAVMILSSQAGAVHNTGHLDFNLAAFCNPMGVMVEGMRENDVLEVNLTTNDIVYAAESRLHGARLFSGKSPQFLYVNVNPIGEAFSASVDLMRRTEDTGFGFSGTVSVWSTGATGTHSGDGQYILGVVSRHLDRFIAEYIRDNKDWCERRQNEKWPLVP